MIDKSKIKRLIINIILGMCCLGFLSTVHSVSESTHDLQPDVNVSGRVTSDLSPADKKDNELIPTRRHPGQLSSDSEESTKGQMAGRSRSSITPSSLSLSSSGSLVTRPRTLNLPNQPSTPISTPPPSTSQPSSPTMPTPPSPPVAGVAPPTGSTSQPSSTTMPTPPSPSAAGVTPPTGPTSQPSSPTSPSAAGVTSQTGPTPQPPTPVKDPKEVFNERLVSWLAKQKANKIKVDLELEDLQTILSQWIGNAPEEIEQSADILIATNYFLKEKFPAVVIIFDFITGRLTQEPKAWPGINEYKAVRQALVTYMSGNTQEFDLLPNQDRAITANTSPAIIKCLLKTMIPMLYIGIGPHLSPMPLTEQQQKDIHSTFMDAFKMYSDAAASITINPDSYCLNVLNLLQTIYCLGILPPNRPRGAKTNVLKHAPLRYIDKIDPTVIPTRELSNLVRALCHIYQNTPATKHYIHSIIQPSPILHTMDIRDNLASTEISIDLHPLIMILNKCHLMITKLNPPSQPANPNQPAFRLFITKKGKLPPTDPKLLTQVELANIFLSSKTQTIYVQDDCADDFKLAESRLRELFAYFSIPLKFIGLQIDDDKETIIPLDKQPKPSEIERQFLVNRIIDWFVHLLVFAAAAVAMASAFLYTLTALSILIAIITIVGFIQLMYAKHQPRTRQTNQFILFKAIIIVCVVLITNYVYQHLDSADLANNPNILIDPLWILIYTIGALVTSLIAQHFPLSGWLNFMLRVLFVIHILSMAGLIIYSFIIQPNIVEGTISYDAIAATLVCMASFFLCLASHRQPKHTQNRSKYVKNNLALFKWIETLVHIGIAIIILGLLVLFLLHCQAAPVGQGVSSKLGIGS
ncbi:hypothetical protein NEHOM01_1406 [Nematocida homosporus]|uniref:uncharacterized protein n=1 Tax=Nematocida homosporus TaxID=1912981 RepID=UPI00221E9ED8|nr:uncharacterized protein NEHOM01_1406 [Nematocida homosporus]KAI5186342.1 hypothetical protein NEHOM01_1406 [Nematocida homosporus]